MPRAQIRLTLCQADYQALRGALITGCQHLNGLIAEFEDDQKLGRKPARGATKEDYYRWLGERERLQELQESLLRNGSYKGWNS